LCADHVTDRLNLASADREIYRRDNEEYGALARKAPGGPDSVTPEGKREKEEHSRLYFTDYLAKSVEHAREAARLRPDLPNPWFVLASTLLDGRNSVDRGDRRFAARGRARARRLSGPPKLDARSGERFSNRVTPHLRWLYSSARTEPRSCDRLT